MIRFLVIFLALSSLAAAPVEFQGNRAIGTDDLRQELADSLSQIESTGVSPTRADDLAFLTELTYEERGYSDTKVTAIISGDSLTLQIDEGSRALLGEITFVGATAFDEKELKKFLLGPTLEANSGDELPYIADDIATGINRLRGLYLADGFLDVAIPDAKPPTGQVGQKLDLTVTIDEGTRYRFGEIRGVDPELVREITEKNYSENRLREIEEIAAYAARRDGYYNAQASAIGLRDQATDGAVPVEVSIERGTPFRFGDISVSGTTRLNPRYVRHRFSHLSGRAYDPGQVNDILEEQLGTGLYDQLRIDQIANGDTIDLAIEVAEAKSKELGLSGGYGTFEGAGVGARFLERNLFGSGRPFVASIELSQRTFGGDVTLDDPYFLGRDDLDLGVRAYALTRELEGYTKNETGFRTQLLWEATEQLSVTPFIQSKFLEITDAAIADQFVGDPDYHLHSAGISATFDTRENPLNPERGFVLGAATEYAFDEFSFLRSTARASYYLPIGNTLLAVGARGGVISSDDSLPIDERFFNGGADSVRSFAYRELGPDDRGFPVGGHTFSVFNVEYTAPVAKSIRAALFFDAGSVGVSEGDFGDLRYGIGAGLRYDLPIGPIRLDYGFNPDRRNGESSGAFHFTIGLAF